MKGRDDHCQNHHPGTRVPQVMAKNVQGAWTSKGLARAALPLDGFRLPYVISRPSEKPAGRSFPGTGRKEEEGEIGSGDGTAHYAAVCPDTMVLAMPPSLTVEPSSGASATLVWTGIWTRNVCPLAVAYAAVASPVVEAGTAAAASRAHQPWAFCCCRPLSRASGCSCCRGWPCG